MFRREPLTSQQVEMIEKAIINEDFMTKFIVIVLLDTGLRVSELVELMKYPNTNLIEIDNQENIIKVFGKGGKYGLNKAITRENKKMRIIPITQRVKILLNEFFLTRKKIIGVRAIEIRIKRLGKKLGFNLTPHLLRHTYAMNLLKAGVSLSAVQKVMGHSRLDTTAIYLNINPLDAIQEIKSKINK